MQKLHDLFGPGSNPKERIVQDYERLAEIIEGCKRLSMRTVLTSGTFDLFHEGHARYLEQARSRGDLLVVGVDNDEKVNQRKGPKRPLVTDSMRMEILCHCRHVDIDRKSVV